MEEFRKKQIASLEKALQFCEEGGCKDAELFIVRRISWLKTLIAD